MTRYDGVGMGKDIKCTMREIKLTPGPSDYETIMEKDSAVVKKSHNYALNNGGVRPPFLKQYREHIKNSALLINELTWPN